VSHVGIHFALGMLLGWLTGAIRVARVWMRNGRLAPVFRNVLLLSYALGLTAVFPSLLGYAGVPETVTSSPWMNVFLFHPWLRAHHPGGTIVGAAFVFACFVVPYAVLLAAIAYRRACRPSV
jgi:hypothetical protein